MKNAVKAETARFKQKTNETMKEKKKEEQRTSEVQKGESEIG